MRPADEDHLPILHDHVGLKSRFGQTSPEVKRILEQGNSLEMVMARYVGMLLQKPLGHWELVKCLCLDLESQNL